MGRRPEDTLPKKINRWQVSFPEKRHQGNANETAPRPQRERGGRGLTPLGIKRGDPGERGAGAESCSYCESD